MKKIYEFLFDFRHERIFWESNLNLASINFTNSELKNKFLNFAYFEKTQLNLDEIVHANQLFNKKENKIVEDKLFDKFVKRTKKKGISDRIAHAHLKYLEFIYEQEKKRQDKLDQKGQILIYQSSILIGIIGIIIPFFFDKAPKINTFYFYIFLTSFIPIPFVIWCLIKSILNGIKSNELQGYHRPAEGLILTHWKDDLNDFETSISSAIYGAIKNNIETNDMKGNFIRIGFKNLYRSLFLILPVILLYSINLLFNEGLNKTQDVNIINEMINIEQKQ